MEKSPKEEVFKVILKNCLIFFENSCMMSTVSDYLAQCYRTWAMFQAVVHGEQFA